MTYIPPWAPGPGRAYEWEDPSKPNQVRVTGGRPALGIDPAPVSRSALGALMAAALAGSQAREYHLPASVLGGIQYGAVGPEDQAQWTPEYRDWWNAHGREQGFQQRSRQRYEQLYRRRYPGRPVPHATVGPAVGGL